MNRALSVSKFSFVLSTFLVFALVIALAVVPAAAQIAKGSLSGTVLDPSGAAVVGAQIKATDPATSQAFTTTSDGSGSFRINLLPPGVYKVEIKRDGFRNTTLSNVSVSSGADNGLGGVKI